MQRASFATAPTLLLAGLALWLATACGSGAHQPVSVTLGQLAGAQETYSGQLVQTTGSVEPIRDSSGAYYVLADAQQDRVTLEPAEQAARFVNRRVTVTGQFHFDAHTGRSLHIATLAPALVATATP